jgi:hypothetical protein
MTFISAMTDKYITSKEATMQAMEDAGNAVRVNSICSISFKAIRQIAGDTNEARKFMSSDLNNVTMKQICVQQLRDIYSTVSTLKESYFTIDEKDTYTNISNCDNLPD